MQELHTCKVLVYIHISESFRFVACPRHIHVRQVIFPSRLSEQPFRLAGAFCADQSMYPSHANPRLS